VALLPMQMALEFSRFIRSTVLVVLLSFSSMTTTARAEITNPCKECRDQQQACAKNYSAKTCKTEYDICMKSCKRKYCD
jgi:hypothetical protein